MLRPHYIVCTPIAVFLPGIAIMKRVSVRQSPVHGKGVFALCPLRAGERIFEYKGMVTTWREAARWNARREVSGHTFLFGLSDGRVIDGGRGGNGARWLNHACAANCEAVEGDGRVYIEAIRDIAAGEELFIDYALEIDEQVDIEAQREYACRCGTLRCRGTMLGAGATQALATVAQSYKDSQVIFGLITTLDKRIRNAGFGAIVAHELSTEKVDNCVDTAREESPKSLIQRRYSFRPIGFVPLPARYAALRALAAARGPLSSLNARG